MKTGDPVLSHGGLEGTTRMAPGKQKRKKKLKPIAVSKATQEMLKGKKNG